MRTVLAFVVLSVFALAPAAGAQSLGELAAKEKAKRKGKSGRVYTEEDLKKAGGSTSSTASTEPAGTTTTAPAGSSTATARPAGEAGAVSETGTTEGADEAAEKARADKEKSWRERWNKANAELDAAKAELAKLTTDYNALPEGARTYIQQQLDATKAKVQKAEQAVSALDDERRFGGYRQ